MNLFILTIKRIMALLNLNVVTFAYVVDTTCTVTPMRGAALKSETDDDEEEMVCCGGGCHSVM